MPNVQVHGHDFHYMEVDGEGPTVLMLSLIHISEPTRLLSIE